MAGTLEDAALEGYAPSPDQIREYMERRRAVIAATGEAASIVVSESKTHVEEYQRRRREKAMAQKEKTAAI